jgi:hypothetical protein
MCVTGYSLLHYALVAPQAKQIRNKKKHEHAQLFATCLTDAA